MNDFECCNMVKNGVVDYRREASIHLRRRESESRQMKNSFYYNTNVQFCFIVV